jgi:hypothetical protein
MPPPHRLAWGRCCVWGGCVTAVGDGFRACRWGDPALTLVKFAQLTIWATIMATAPSDAFGICAAFPQVSGLF